jgi:hypothetical protein
MKIQEKATGIIKNVPTSEILNLKKMGYYIDINCLNLLSGPNH